MFPSPSPSPSPSPARTARLVAAVISMGTFGVIAGALAANASAGDNAKVTTDQPTTTVATTPTLPGYGGDGGEERSDDDYDTEDGTVAEQSPWGAQPGVPPSGGVSQQGPSTQSNGS